VPLEGQWSRANTPLRNLTQRERRAALVGLAVTVIAVVALIVGTAGNSRPAPGPGCVRANVAGVMGASEINLCGQHAKRLCARNAELSDPNALTIQASCRDAGLLKPS
jgi:hypothetical protein